MRRQAVGDPVRTAGCSLSVYDPCHLSGRIVIESMSLLGTKRTSRAGLIMSVVRGRPECAGRPARSRWCKSITMKE